VENFMPVVRMPCQPLCPVTYVFIGETHRHIESRNGARMDAHGDVWGDEQFQILYDAALRNDCRYHHANNDLKNAAESGKLQGTTYSLIRSQPYREVLDERGDRITVPNIKVAEKDKKDDIVLGFLHTPFYGTNLIFHLVNDICWHRHMLPFGFYFYENVPCTNRGWQDWNAGLISPPDHPHLRINPYSVTHLDMLYLLVTQNYYDRYIHFVSMLLWCQNRGCNVLRFYTHGRCRDQEFAMHMTLERHLHLFGSLVMFLEVLRDTNIDNKFPLADKLIKQLDNLLKRCTVDFGAKYEKITTYLPKWIVKKVGTTNLLQQVFPEIVLVKIPR
jgi:hypothetical protein